MRPDRLLLKSFIGLSMFVLSQNNDHLFINKQFEQTSNSLSYPAAEPNVVQVNIYGGNYPAPSGWNNWNVQSNLTLSNLKYANGASSAISANLTLSNAVADNGATYPVTMCPAEVGRTASYSTVARYLTLSGLDNTKRYILEVYASRNNSGNSTKFSIGGRSIAVVTDRNYTTKAVFTDLLPAAGKISLYIERLNTYNYINGFTLRESDSVPVNIPPIASAGPNQVITLPVNQVTLNGTSSSDPDGTISSYRWQRITGPGNPVIANPQSATTLVYNLEKGLHVFNLTVKDNAGDSAVASTQVTVNEQLPPPSGSDSLNCGKVFKIVILGSSTAMGSGATPIDSAWANKYRRYVRGKNTQSTVTNLALSGFTTYHILCPTGFVPPANRPAPDTAHNITKALSYSPDLIIISLPSNDAQKNFPLAEQQANYERTMALANTAGIAVWVTTTQPRNGMNQAQMNLLTSMRDWTFQRFGEKAIDFWTGIANPDGTVNPLYNVDGVHVNNDGHNLLYTRVVAEHLLDTLCLRKNLKPSAKAGSDISITLPTSTVQLNGSLSGDPDGTITSYKWIKITGPSRYAISNPGIASPVLSDLVEGVYCFQLTVTDNMGASAVDSVSITVKPSTLIPPVALAGDDIILVQPASSTTLNGNNSYDPDGMISTYAWTKVSGPPSYLISNAGTASPVVSNLSEGVYQFRLVVRDNSGLTDDDTVSVTVNPAANVPPVANAGPDQLITQPLSSVTLNGTASTDPDGSITSYRWLQLTGPSTATLPNVTSPTTVASNLVLPGNYSFQLTVRDNRNTEDKDTVQVTVYPSSPQTNKLQVNIFSGSYPAGPGWNNWNVQSSLTLASTIYSDGSSAPVKATLSLSNAVADNGTNYPVTMCPTEVGRTASYSTVMRLLTLTGLDNNKKYDLEVYASRNGTGNSTKFSVGTNVVNITTDRNYTNKAVFRLVTPQNGTIQLKIERLNTYNYINGFTLTESQTIVPNLVAPNQLTKDVAIKEEAENLTVYPNPFSDYFMVKAEGLSGQPLQIALVDHEGKVVYRHNTSSTGMTVPLMINTAHLPAGVYYLKVFYRGGIRIKKIIKSAVF